MSEYDTGYTDEHRYTTDHEAIRNWAEARDAIPVAGDDEGASDGDRSEESSAGAGDYRFVAREEHDRSDEEEAWESFFEAFEEDERALVYREESEGDDGVDFHELPRRAELADSGAEQLEETQAPSRDG